MAQTLPGVGCLRYYAVDLHSNPVAKIREADQYLKKVKSNSLEHLEELLPVAAMKLDDEIRAACAQLVPQGSVVANFHNTADWMKIQIR